MANLSNPSEYRRQVFAQDGFRVVTSAFSQPAGEEYVAVYAIDDVTGLTTTTDAGDALGSIAVTAGTVIYGNFKTVSVATGTVIAYIK